MKLILIKLKGILKPEAYEKLNQWIKDQGLEEEIGDKKKTLSIDCIYDKDLLIWLKEYYNKLLTKRRKLVKKEPKVKE